jgi:hypothetical protein
MQSTLPIIAPAAGAPSTTRRPELWVYALTALSLPLWLGLLAVDLPPNLFLALHSALEVGSIVVAALGFGIAWHAYAHERPANLVLLGVALLGTGLIDFAHTLSYAGMPEWVTPSGGQKAVSFWLAARLLAAAGLLAVALRPWKPFADSWARYRLLGAVLLYVAVVYWFILFSPQQVPSFFVPGSGLTPLKVQIEYLLVLMYAAAAWQFHRQSRQDGGLPVRRSCHRSAV